MTSHRGRRRGSEMGEWGSIVPAVTRWHEKTVCVLIEELAPMILHYQQIGSCDVSR